MVMTESTMMPLGTIAPDFALPDTLSGQTVRLADTHDSIATVIMFICNHCPFVKHVLTELVQLAQDYQPRNVRFIAINANDIDAYPDDAPEHMQTLGKQLGFTFPYLFDAEQSVAKAYRAACTPDFYLFDATLSCVYRGQLDDSRPGNNRPVTGRDLRDALEALLQGQAISAVQTPSIGCNIKWKAK